MKIWRNTEIIERCRISEIIKRLAWELLEYQFLTSDTGYTWLKLLENNNFIIIGLVRKFYYYRTNLKNFSRGLN